MTIKNLQEKRTEYRLNKKDRLKTDEILRENNLISRQPSELKPYHSFVIHTGKVGRHVRQLERDLRRLMSPHTSNELKVPLLPMPTLYNIVIQDANQER